MLSVLVEAPFPLPAESLCTAAGIDRVTSPSDVIPVTLTV